MSPPHPTLERRASRPIIAAVLALALASCGDSGAVLESAQRQLAAGRANRALALLERVEGESATYFPKPSRLGEDLPKKSRTSYYTSKSAFRNHRKRISTFEGKSNQDYIQVLDALRRICRL